MRVLDPTAGQDLADVSAPRLGKVRGTHVGILWNNRPRGDRVLKAIGSRLEDEFGATVSFASKLRVGSGAETDEVKLFEKAVQAVIVGVGD